VQNTYILNKTVLFEFGISLFLHAHIYYKIEKPNSI